MQLLSGGELIAQGTKKDSIIFTGNGDEITWKGIVFNEDAVRTIFSADTSYLSGMIINFATIENISNTDFLNAGLKIEVPMLIKNTLFRNNVGYMSGVIYYNSSNYTYSNNFLVIDSSNFINNEIIQGGDRGSAIHCSSTNSLLKISSCNFSFHNRAVINIYTGGKLYIKNSTFTHNNQGVIIGTGEKIINNCKFNHNSSNSEGGAIYSTDYLTITNSTFSYNYSAKNGGALYCACIKEVSNCIFLNNISTSNGGAICGRHHDDEQSLIIKNNIFMQNQAANGGSFYGYFKIAFTENLFINNSATNLGGNIYLPYNGTLLSNYFYDSISDNSTLLYGNFTGSKNSFFSTQFNYFIKASSGNNILNLKDNYWSSKDSAMIAASLYDFYDDPNFSTNIIEFVPYLAYPADDISNLPSNFFDIMLMSDSSYQIILADSIYIGSTLYIQINAVDNNKYCPDLTPAYIINLSSQDTVITTLVESSDSTGIFRGIASVQAETDNINDIIGANSGDEIKIVSITDSTIYYSFTVAQTPPSEITDLDVGGDNDIYHILSSNPIISWNYSDPLSSPQSGYQVQVGLDTNWTTAEMWDTGEINSSDTFAVYSGSTLHEDSTYYIRVRVNNGTIWSSWADTSFGLNSYPQMSLIDTSVVEDDTLILNLNEFIFDSDDSDSALNISVIQSENIITNIDSVNHNVSFIPKENWNGSEAINFICEDPWGYQASDSLILTVLPRNDFPVIVTTELPNAVEDQNYSFEIEANDVDIIYGDHLTYSLTIYPEGMAINNTTGEINWFPDNEDVGDTTLTVVVTDDSSATDTKTYTLIVINVNDPPFLYAIPDTSFDEDSQLSIALSYFYTYVYEPDNADSTLTFAFSSTDYINVNTSGDSLLLCAQTDWNGTDTIQVIVSDESLSDTTSWRIIVNPVNDAPLITSADIVTATEDIYFKYLATASDIEDSSITFDFEKLPSWLSSDADSVYGIPTEGMKDTSFVLIASDGELDDTLKVILTVIPVNDPPVISAIPDTSFNEDEQLKFAISYFYDFVYDPDNADSTLALSFSGTDYINVSMNEDSVVISSEKDWFGKDALLLIVSDDVLSDSTNWIITVHPVNDPPYFTEFMPVSISFDSNVRDTLLLTGLASDVDNPDTSFVWSYIHSNFVLCQINDTLKSAIFWVEQNISGQDTIVMSISDGEFTVYDSLIVIVSPVTGIEYLMSQIPKEYSLKQNYPNPFNPTTTIIYGLPKLSHVDIRIYDLLGREVTTLVNDKQEAKHYKVIWDAKDRSGNDIPSGMYLYRIVAKSGDRTFVKTRKLLLMR
jgi:predicted outer membrane repeat protein